MTPTEIPRPTAPEPYHHGDLPNALRHAAADLLSELGVAGFSLREVARRAGVSHAAPAHHFGDARGLLTAVAVEAFQQLTIDTEAAAAGVDDPVDALAAIGRAYVMTSVNHPGHCAVVFRQDALDPADPAYQAWGERAFGVVHDAVKRLAREQAPELDVDLAAALCWSMVQGLITVHGPLQALAARDGRVVPGIGDLAEQLTRLLVEGLVGRR